MIPDDTLNRQIAQFSQLGGFDRLVDDENAVAHMKRAMKEADSDELLERAVIVLIQQEGREFVPKPGEIVQVIRQLVMDDEMAGKRPAPTTRECYRCHNQGFFRTSLDDSGMQMPCSCARGRRWREMHPDLVVAYDAACDAAEKRMAVRKPSAKPRQKPGSLTRVSQILGRDLR